MIAFADAHVRRQQRNGRRCSCLLRIEIEINLSLSDWHNRCAPINIIKLVIEIIFLSPFLLCSAALRLTPLQLRNATRHFICLTRHVYSKYKNRTEPSAALRPAEELCDLMVLVR